MHPPDWPNLVMILSKNEVAPLCLHSHTNHIFLLSTTNTLCWSWSWYIKYRKTLIFKSILNRNICVFTKKSYVKLYSIYFILTRILRIQHYQLGIKGQFWYHCHLLILRLSPKIWTYKPTIISRCMSRSFWLSVIIFG